MCDQLMLESASKSFEKKKVQQFCNQLKVTLGI